jgi:alanyl-tRNA synthetase
VRRGIFLANIGTYSDPGTVVELAELAEAAGREALLMWDHLGFVWGMPAADPWVTLAATKDLVEKGIKAGDLIRELARDVGGSGGGKPDMAQAGGKHPEKLPEALEIARQAVAKLLGR